MRERLVTLPRSSTRNCPQAFAKLLSRVEVRAGRGVFHGTLMRPGSVVEESKLRPSPEYPRVPVLLECAGVFGGRGHHRGECLWVLWRLDGASWDELGRAKAEDWRWQEVLQPLASAAVDAERPAPVPVDISGICDRVLAFVDAELRPLQECDRIRALSTMEHDLCALWNAIHRSAAA
jgi:hypothetical protein